MIFIGIDLGTQGVRTLAVNERGKVLSRGAADYRLINTARLDGRREQSPAHWWEALLGALSQTLSALDESALSQVTAMCIDGTSGTVVPVDRQGNHLCDAIMYNDPRGGAYVKALDEAGKDVQSALGYKMNASFGLPKLAWIKANAPDIYEKTYRFCHQADYIAGRLCGNYNATDLNNVLKTGFDIVNNVWPEYVTEVTGDRLPHVCSPGRVIGELDVSALEGLKLPKGVKLVAGCTDGVASSLASGAVHDGDYNTTVGSTLVLKGVTKKLILDPMGRVYCHKFPGGGFMPGGASNVGGLCLNKFGKENFDRLNASIRGLAPTGALIYPLQGRGERFPFVDPDAAGFTVRLPYSDESNYMATLEGIAYTERLCYETLWELGCTPASSIHIAGGTGNSREFLQIRSSVMNCTLYQPAVLDAAMGSAIIAGSQSVGRSVAEAADDMVTYRDYIEPDPAFVNEYESLYGEFREQLRLRHYIA